MYALADVNGAPRLAYRNRLDAVLRDHRLKKNGIVLVEQFVFTKGGHSLPGLAQHLGDFVARFAPPPILWADNRVNSSLGCSAIRL
jgi:hypothetical protein